MSTTEITVRRPAHTPAQIARNDLVLRLLADSARARGYGCHSQAERAYRKAVELQRQPVGDDFFLLNVVA